MIELAVNTTPIPGLLVVDLPLHGDPRGWFKENWQRAKMVALGLPDFRPVQNNMSFNADAGVTRGFHAEPWDKLVSVAHGRIFGAWVDLRPGPGFGAVFTQSMGPETAVFVPRGVGNAFQALEPDTVYAYLVNQHWSPQARDSYTYVNLADETLAVDWPIPLASAEISDADRYHPRLPDVTPMPPKQTLIVGARGQLGRALATVFPDAVAVGRPHFDVTDPNTFTNIDWPQVGTLINASAYTAVDDAESEQGRRDCWATNVTGLARLVDIAREHNITLVHVSSDYVFDGSQPVHDEDEPFSPLGVYGQTKAAGDALVATLPEHYIVRTSWVIGDGRNFVSTMVGLAQRGVSPDVVNDQFGRLTFTSDLARGIRHLTDTSAPFGTYNLTSAGEVQSWFDIAQDVFALAGRDRVDVSPLTTSEFSANKLVAPRPTNSALSLSKIEATGFTPRPAATQLADYVAELLEAGE